MWVIEFLEAIGAASIIFAIRLGYHSSGLQVLHPRAIDKDTL